jgi:heptosyltransferase I
VALIRGATVMISSDTGPIHLAAAAGTPIVGIYGPTSPKRNGPWSGADINVSRYSACVCHHKRRCSGRIWCLDEITVDDVFQAVVVRLERAEVSRRRPMPF